MTRTERKEERRQYRLLVKQSEEPKPPLEIRWWLLWHTPLKEHLANLYKSIKPYLTVKMIISFAIAWFITNGHAYMLFGWGMIDDIEWMKWYGGAYVAILYMPFTPEKIITIPLGVWFYKILFRKTIDKRRLIK